MGRITSRGRNGLNRHLPIIEFEEFAYSREYTTMKVHSVIIVILSCLVLPASLSCPSPCRCIALDKGTEVDCRNKGLDELPDHYPDGTTVLDLGGNFLDSIVASTFPNLPDLNTLILDDNRITSIQQKAFSWDNLPNLRNLSLSHNQISRVQGTSFDRLSTLRFLYLDHNSLQSFPEFFFYQLNLSELHLQNNKLNSLTDMTFDQCYIHTLDLSSNDFRSIGENTFTPMKDSLKNLSISSNARDLELSTNVFKDLNLDSLSLAYSKLKNHAFLEHLLTKKLDISGNLFSDYNFENYINLRRLENLVANDLDLPMITKRTSLLTQMHKLRFLSMERSQVQHIGDQTFSNTPELVWLNLASNQLLSFEPGQYLGKLEYLNLSNNSIHGLKFSSYEGLGNLTELDLRFNHIQTIDNGFEAILTQLEDRIHLQGSPLHCNCEILWLREFLLKSKFGKSMGIERCATPRNASFWELSPNDFVCTAPEIIILGNATCPNGSLYTWICKARSDPAPKMMWLHPGGTSTHTTPPANKSVYTNSVYYQKRVKTDERYECTAENLMGRVTEVSTVTVYTGPTQLEACKELIASTTEATTRTVQYSSLDSTMSGENTRDNNLFSERITTELIQSSTTEFLKTHPPLNMMNVTIGPTKYTKGEEETHKTSTEPFMSYTTYYIPTATEDISRISIYKTIIIVLSVCLAVTITILLCLGLMYNRQKQQQRQSYRLNEAYLGVGHFVNDRTKLKPIQPTPAPSGVEDEEEKTQLTHDLSHI